MHHSLRYLPASVKLVQQEFFRQFLAVLDQLSYRLYIPSDKYSEFQTLIQAETKHNTPNEDIASETGSVQNHTFQFPQRPDRSLAYLHKQGTVLRTKGQF